MGAPLRLVPQPTDFVGYRAIFVPQAVFFDITPTFFANLLLFSRIFWGIGPGVHTPLRKVRGLCEAGADKLL
ncbi:MAG: hypothetical protein AAF361_08605 [Bacteroidota bacterium]